MNSPGDNRQTNIVRLTEAAAGFAELGRWDAVAECYRERGALLAGMQPPDREASDMLKLDEQVRERVRAAQALLVSLLGEATATRQRLQGLHQRLRVASSGLVTVSMKA